MDSKQDERITMIFFLALKISAYSILDCLSEVRFQNLVRLTEQAGPEGEIFIGCVRVKDIGYKKVHVPGYTLISYSPNYVEADKKVARHWGRSRAMTWNAIKHLKAVQQFFVN